MQCIRPLKAGYDVDGNVTHRLSHISREMEGFSHPCGKCLPCRLNKAREKAIRCWHESKSHKDSIFLTLTYDEENLKSPRLIYSDWQKFMKSLREYRTRDVLSKAERESLYMPVMVTGEYGDQNKRPHWHALIFNYRPKEEKFKYETDRGDKVFESTEIDRLWKKGAAEYGEVTMDSANYVARYAAKKLTHGYDGMHNYEPIHRTSSKYGIGRNWISRYFRQTFESGYIVLPNGQKSKIPRYYVDWCKEHQPQMYMHYVTEVLPKVIIESKAQAEKEMEQWIEQMKNRDDALNLPKKRANVKETILQSKFKKLQENLKL